MESGKNTSNWNKGQGALQINGGSITNNTATGNGGGVYINKRGLLTITGGNVTDNTATVNGGGLYFNGESKKFNISGNINVTGNKKSGKANNIYLPNGQIIKIMGELTNTAPIGVTTEVEPNSSNYVQIASGRAAYATPDKFQYENNDTSISAVLSGSNNLLVACEHNWGTTWQTDSTSHWHSCSICNGKDNIVNHSGGTATCTEKAICEGCSLPYGNTLGHDFTGDTWQTDADHHWKKCSRCDVTDTESPHEWNSGKVTTQPTCTTAGQKTYTCTVCSATKVETLDALGHNFAKYDAKAATCTEIGWNTYFTCTNCNYTTYKEIAALGLTRFLIKPRLRPVQKRAGMLTIPVLVAITPATKKSLPSVMISPVTHGRVMPTGIGRSAPAAKLPEKRLNIPVARQPVRTEPFVPPVLRPMVHWMPNIM